MERSGSSGHLCWLHRPIYNQNGLKKAVTDSVGQWRVTVTPAASLPDLGHATAISVATFLILLVVSIAQGRTLRRNLQMQE
jgi:hypothetical protein